MATLKLSLDGVNYVNIGLMVISMILAVNIPFELFLFVYAVLGPLHYMTEIGWLHKKNYFAIEKRDFVIPIAMCVLISISVLLSLAAGWEKTSEWMASAQAGTFGPVIRALDRYSPSFIFLAFAAAIFMVVIKKRTWRYLLIALMIIPAVLIIDLKFYDEEYITWFAVFLPTIVHVCVFTALFILFGAMKSKSMSGYISFGVYILCIILLFQIGYDPKEYAVSTETLQQLRKSTFDQLNYSLWDLIHPIREKTFFIDGKLGLKIQAFIAFAYTYHYLNWFSKTEIIKWHDVPKPWLILTIVVWIASILLYRYDYRVGLLSLYFLSMLHVFLEFPLNIQSLIGIGKEGSGWFRKSTPSLSK
jgi:hypothetical protein